MANTILEEMQRQEAALQPKPNSFGDAAAAAGNTGVTQIGAAPLPKAGPSQIPTGGLKAPAEDGTRDSPLNTDFGRNVTNTLAALPGASGIPGASAAAGGLVARAFGASAPAVSAAARVGQAVAPYAPIAGGAAALHSAAGASSPTIPATAPKPAPPGGTTSSSAAAPAALPSPSASPAWPGTTEQPSLTSNVTRSGSSYSGSNIGGDITINGAAPRTGGLVSAANLRVADNLASQQTPAPAAPMGLVQAAGLQSPVVRHSGNDWQMRNDLRNAQVSASSITNNGGRWDQHKGVSPERAYAAALEQADTKARFAQPGVDLATQRENASLQREGMQQQGANSRSLVQAALEQKKINQAGQELGYKTRAMGLVEAARNQVAAEKDPTKRRGLVQYMNDIEGKITQADPYLVVPGGQHVDPTSGKAYNTPSTVFNRQTGAFVQQPEQGGQTAPAVGSVQGGYRFKGGDPSAQTSWEKV